MLWEKDGTVALHLGTYMCAIDRYAHMMPMSTSASPTVGLKKVVPVDNIYLIYNICARTHLHFGLFFVTLRPQNK